MKAAYRREFTRFRDFSSTKKARELFIGDDVYKAFVSVGKAGSEAAAAPAVLLLGAAPGTPAELRIDRSFTFLSVIAKRAPSSLWVG